MSMAAGRRVRFVCASVALVVGLPVIELGSGSAADEQSPGAALLNATSPQRSSSRGGRAMKHLVLGVQKLRR
jgi:hypothetical protein